MYIIYTPNLQCYSIDAVANLPFVAGMIASQQLLAAVMILTRFWKDGSYDE